MTLNDFNIQKQMNTVLSIFRSLAAIDPSFGDTITASTDNTTGVQSAIWTAKKGAYASDFSLNRVLLHTGCLLRRPKKAAFFIAGIRREFALLLQ
jgi:hypothetical protein